MSVDVATEVSEAPESAVPEEVTIWNKIGWWFPHIVAVGYAGVIGGAFSIQLLQGEMPCPLCMLQRMGMILVGIAAVWMIGLARKGKLDLNRYVRAYGLMLLAALLGAGIAVRQIELHILPGDPGYGEAVMGFHLYTWAFVTFFVVMIYTAVMLLFGKMFMPAVPEGKAALWVSRILIAIFFLIIIANIVSVFLEEGFSWYLDDDPVRYELLYQLGIKS